MGEKMTLERVREWHLEKAMEFVRMQNRFPNDSTVLTSLEKMHQDMADALATPAQTVDIEAVREVIANLDCVGSAGSDHYSSEYLQDAINDASDKLSQAIGDKT